jgi:hypothetical protein
MKEVSLYRIRQLLHLPVELPVNNNQNILARTAVVVMKITDPHNAFPYKLQIPKDKA